MKFLNSNPLGLGLGRPPTREGGAMQCYLGIECLGAMQGVYGILSIF